MSDALPMNSVQVATVEGKRVRATTPMTSAAWDKMPDDPDDAGIPEEANPFEVDDEDSTGRAQAQEDVSAAQHEVHGAHEGLSLPVVGPVFAGTSPVVSAAMSLTRWPVPTTHTCIKYMYHAREGR